MIYGYIYIILVREFAKNGEYIIKIGFTLQKCIYMRLNNYSYKSELIYYFYVSNPQELEKIIIKKLSSEFSNDELKYLKLNYGAEYFKMDVNKLYDIVHTIVKDNIISTFNLLKDINNNKFKKISIYFNEKINKDLYTIFYKQYTEFNYTNRIEFISKIINNIIEHKISSIENLYNYFSIQYIQIEDNQIQDNQIQDNQIQDNQIQNNQIQNNQIQNNQIQNNQIQNNQIQDNQIQNNQIQDNQNVLQINNNSVKGTLNYNKKNSFYICYNCLHMTFLKSDLNKHLHRKEPCEAKYNYLLSKDEIIKKSLYNRFYLLEPIKIKDLEKYHLIMLVTQYNNKLNIISNINKINKINESNSTIQITNIFNEQDKKIENIKNINDCIVIINGQKRYKCFDCNTTYKKKESLNEHFNNTKLCNKKKELNKLFEMKKIMAITDRLKTLNEINDNK